MQSGESDEQEEPDPEELKELAEMRSRQQREGSDEPDDGQELPPEDQERNGLDLTGTSAYRINSLFDLFGSGVRIDIEGEDTILDSPWTDDPASIHDALRLLEDKVTPYPGQAVEGRLNASLASREALAGLPGMTVELLDAIVAAQTGLSGSYARDESADRSTSAWLVYEGIADIDQMRRLAPYITARGDVFRLHAVGYFDSGAPVAHVEAIIDATQQPPRVQVIRDQPPMALSRASSWKQDAEGRRRRPNIRN